MRFLALHSSMVQLFDLVMGRVETNDCETSCSIFVPLTMMVAPCSIGRDYNEFPVSVFFSS